MKQVKTIFTFVGVWFIASLLNGLLSGISIAVVGQDIFSSIPGSIFLSCIFSFLFSAPLVGFVWLITAIAQAHGQKGHSLFQITLKSTIFFSVLGALFFINAFGNEFKEAKYAAGICIVFSAMTSVLSFRHKIKTNE